MQSLEQKIKDKISDPNVPIMKKRELLTALREVYRRQVTESFHYYMLFLEFDREPEKRYYQPRMRVMKPVVEEMEKLILTDELDLLCLSMPPGVGKSTLGIFFLTWVMGLYPDNCNLGSGHSSTLTRSIYDGVMEVVGSPEYNYKEAFPESTKNIITNAKEGCIDLNKAHRFSTLTTRSIDGSLTGATRAEKILYVDDLVSGIEEAMSMDRLDKLWSKYFNDLKSRKKNQCKEIHIATRWSVHDPIGRLEKIYGDSPRSRFIKLPALDPEKGTSNFEFDYGVGFDTQFYLDLKENMDAISYGCLYDQEPMEREGLVFAESETNYYTQLPEGEPTMVISSCDVAFGGGDSTSMPIGYMYGNDVYIVDVVHDKGKPEVVQPRLAQKIDKYCVKRAEFEMNNGGMFFADEVRKRLKTRCNITKKRSTSNKLTRIITFSPIFKDFFYLDKSLQSKEYRDFMKEVHSYSQTGKVAHDDAPDSLAMMANMLENGVTNKKFIDRKRIPI